MIPVNSLPIFELTDEYLVRKTYDYSAASDSADRGCNRLALLLSLGPWRIEGCLEAFAVEVRFSTQCRDQAINMDGGKSVTTPSEFCQMIRPAYPARCTEHSQEAGYGVFDFDQNWLKNQKSQVFSDGANGQFLGISAD